MKFLTWLQSFRKQLAEHAPDLLIQSGFRRNAFRLLCALPLCASTLFFLFPVSTERFTGKSSLVLLSKEGNILRQFRDSDRGAFSDWTPLEKMHPFLIAAVIKAEDRRFYFHPGIDPPALLRAAFQDLFSFSIVSGGSSITQQLARIVYADRMPRFRPLRKIVEALYAIKLELHFSKKEILECYMNRIPLRYNRIGFPEEARFIFGRDTGFLTEEEALALAVLVRRSEMGKMNFRRRFADLAGRLDRKPDITDAFVDSVIAKRPSKDAERIPSAPHFSDWIRSKFPAVSGEIRTEISDNLAKQITYILESEIANIDRDGNYNGAVVVFEIQDDGPFILRALVGSRDFFDPQAGQVNGALAVRTAGSTLKPFVYGLAMEKNILRPNTIVHDEESTFETSRRGETYRPRNYDMNFWGDMTAREALASSRNIPAVQILENAGEAEFFDLLANLDMKPAIEDPDQYGGGLALGTGGSTLFDLTKAYAMLASGGDLRPVLLGEELSGDPLILGRSHRIFSEATAFRIRDILSDREARKRSFGQRSFLDFPFDVAAKTGTSKDYRDSWTAGFSSRFAVGVWVGNFAGESMNSVSGATGAGRVFQQVMRLFASQSARHFQNPPGWHHEKLCRRSGHLAQNGCPSYLEIFPPGEELPPPCDGAHRTRAALSGTQILSPLPGEVFLLDPQTPLSVQGIPLELNCASSSCRWKLDTQSPAPFQGHLKRNLPVLRGKHTIQLESEIREFEVR